MVIFVKSLNYQIKFICRLFLKFSLPRTELARPSERGTALRPAAKSSWRRESTEEPRPGAAGEGLPRRGIPTPPPTAIFSSVMISPGEGGPTLGLADVWGVEGADPPREDGAEPPREERIIVSGNGAGFWFRGGLEPTTERGYAAETTTEAMGGGAGGAGVGRVGGGVGVVVGAGGILSSGLEHDISETESEV